MRGSVIVLTSMGIVAGSVVAAPLNIVPANSPDVFSSFIDVSYSAGSDTLNADGFAFTFDDDGVGAALPITGGLFSLSATVDGSGAASGGSLTITGGIPGLGIAGGLLLSGSLTAFGFPTDGSETLEFLFNVTGGALAGLYGSETAVILTSSGFGGSWASSWDNTDGIPGTGSAVSDTAPQIPAGPTGVILAGAGLLVIRRRR